MEKNELLQRAFPAGGEIKELANRMMDRAALREREPGLATRLEAFRATVQAAWDTGQRAPAGAPSGRRNFSREESRAWRAAKDLRNDRQANN